MVHYNISFSLFSVMYDVCGCLLLSLDLSHLAAQAAFDCHKVVFPNEKQHCSEYPIGLH